jgi:hypothetical protein
LSRAERKRIHEYTPSIKAWIAKSGMGPVHGAAARGYAAADAQAVPHRTARMFQLELADLFGDFFLVGRSGSAGSAPRSMRTRRPATK